MTPHSKPAKARPQKAVKARIMFGHRSGGFLFVEDGDVRQQHGFTMPVAVLPLDRFEAMVERMAMAIFAALGQPHNSTEDVARAALRSIGVCERKKGRAK